MLDAVQPFSGMSVDDVAAARRFWTETLGYAVDDDMGGFSVRLPKGGRLWIYPKQDHVPATFTVLNFPVEDIDAAVAELNARGVSTTIYPVGQFHTDERGIVRGRAAGRGPDIAWFTDPAGNVMSVLH